MSLERLKADVGFILAGIYFDGVIAGVNEDTETTYSGAVEGAEKIHALYMKEIERLKKARKDDAELIKSLRHRFRSGMPYGDERWCPTDCGTDFCKRSGCRFTDG